MINEFVLLDGRGGLDIGSSTSISMFSKIYTGSHKTYSDTFEYYKKPTKIGDCCWIGTSSIIMPGSKMNDRSILSVNSVFKGEAEENGIYVGNPAVMTRKRELDKNYEMKIVAWMR